MVTPSQLNSWRPDQLAGIADAVADHRRALTRLNDDMDAGKPPASWTFADADAARVEHDRLAAALATQVSETAGIATALDAAQASIRAAQADLTGALRRAAWNDVHVDLHTGAANTTRDEENPDDADYARTVAAEIAEQIAGALAAAQAADDALAAALTVASTTDVNTLGSLDVQREIIDFQGLSDADQAKYLLEHPEEFDRLDDYASPAAKELLGEAIATELREVAEDEDLFNDPAWAERSSALLAAFGDDPAVMASTYASMEADGLMATLGGVASALYNGSNIEALEGLAEELRSGLETASLDPDFDGEAYGKELVEYATYADDSGPVYGPMTTASGRIASLDFLLREGDYGESFVRGVVWELDEFERANPQMEGDFTHWDSYDSPLNHIDGAGLGFQSDPMAHAMGQFANHPELGLEFFSDGDDAATRTEYYFAERDWSRDGFAGISEAALAIGTDPENLTGAPEATARFVSEYFDRLPDNPEFNAENAAGASEPVANLLKFYTPAMALGFDSENDYDVEQELGHIGEDEDSYLPRINPYPLVDRPDLDGLLRVAFSTDEGVARIAEGMAGFRQGQLAEFVAQHPEGAAADPGGLKRILTTSAGLEGYLQCTTGTIAIEGAQSQAQRMDAFTSLVSTAAGLAPVPGAGAAADWLGQAGKNVVQYAWHETLEIPSEQIDQAYSDNVRAVTEEQNADAGEGENRVVINSYRSLVQAGLLDMSPDITSNYAPSGVPDFDDIPGALLATAARDMGEAMTQPDIVEEMTLRGIYDDQFREFFETE